MKQYFILFSLFFSSFSLCAQDIHFSQFFSIPGMVSPAKTGYFNGNYKISGIYRSQWRSVTTPYNTGVVSADLSMASGRKRTSAVGFGLILGSDKAGDSHFSTSRVIGSFAYHQALGRFGEQHISFGFQAGINSSFVDYSLLHFDEEFMGGGSSEILNIVSAKYADVNAGIQWNYVLDKHSSSLTFGTSVYHLNNPSFSFMGSTESRIDQKFIIDGGADIFLSRKYQIYPRAYFSKMGPLTELIAGLFGSVDLKPFSRQDQRFYAGAFYRWKDAVILMIKMDVQNITISFSYDINVSKLSAVSYGMGGPELSLSFHGILNGVKKKNVHCPRF